MFANTIWTRSGSHLEIPMSGSLRCWETSSFSPSIEQEADYYCSNNFPRAFEAFSASLLSLLSLAVCALALSFCRLPVYIFFTVPLNLSFPPFFLYIDIIFFIFVLVHMPSHLMATCFNARLSKTGWSAIVLHHKSKHIFSLLGILCVL